MFTVCWKFPASLLSHLLSFYHWIPPGCLLDRFRGRFSGGSSAWIFRKGKKRPGQPRKMIYIHQALTLFLFFLLRGTRITHRRRRWGWSSSRSGWCPSRGWLSSQYLWWVFLRNISPLSLSSRVLSMGTCWSHPLMRSLPLPYLTLVIWVFPSGRRPGQWNLVNNSLFLCPGTFWSLGIYKCFVKSGVTRIIHNSPNIGVNYHIL